MYIVLAFDQYYPRGGADEIELTTEDSQEAHEKALELVSPDAERRWDWVHVYDTDTKTRSTYR